MATPRRLRQIGRRPACAGRLGSAVPSVPPGTALLLAALIAATSLAALQLSSARESPFAGLPGFVAAALGSPRDGSRAPTGWRTFANGISRPTAWGHETIGLQGGRASRYLTVSRRQGVRVWRWRLAAHGLASARPARILDAQGRNVTPPDLRWSLRRDGGDWLVRLRVEDATLPLPYVIEPTTPAPRGLR